MRFDAYGAVATICSRIGPIANSDSTLVASHRPIARGSEVCMEETTNVMQRQSPRIILAMFPPCQNSFHSQVSRVAEAFGFIEHSKEFRLHIQWPSGCLLLCSSCLLAYHYHWLALKKEAANLLQGDDLPNLRSQEPSGHHYQSHHLTSTFALAGGGGDLHKQCQH